MLQLLCIVPTATDLAAQSKRASQSDSGSDDEDVTKRMTLTPRAAREQVSRQSKPKIYLPDCTQPKNHDEADLCEQMRMADSANKSERIADRQYGVTIAAAFITGLAAFFTGWAALEAGRAARAAARSADISERAMRALERPYLIIQKIDTTKLLPVEADRRPAIDFTIVNYGKTPGILRTLAVRLQSNPNWPLRLPFAHRKEYTVVVEPGKRLPHRGGDDCGTVEVEGSQPGQAFGGVQMASLVFQGSIHYEDPTGAHHIERFCLRGNRDGASWTLEGGAKFNWRKTTYSAEKRDETDT